MSIKRFTEDSFVSLTIAGVAISVAMGVGVTLANVNAEIKEIRQLSENNSTALNTRGERIEKINEIKVYAEANRKIIDLHADYLEKLNDKIDAKLDTISARINSIEKSVSGIDGSIKVLMNKTHKRGNNDG